MSGELDSLIKLLNQVTAKEFVLFVDESLVALLSALAPYSTLTRHGVKALVPLTPDASTMATSLPYDAAVYLTTADPAAIALVSQSAATYLPGSVTIIVTPEISPSVPLLLSKASILGDVELLKWPLSLIPDVSGQNLLQCYDKQSVKDQSGGVWSAVSALDTLQARITGRFAKVTSVGPRARRVADLLNVRCAEQAVKQQNRASTVADDNSSMARAVFDYHFGYSSATFFGQEVGHAIIIDRDLDLVTPLLIQTSYGGVLAETVGVSAAGTTGTKVGPKHSLKGDAFYISIADKVFDEACQELHARAKQLRESFRHGSGLDTQNSSISDIKSVVAKLGSMQATQRLVDTHTDIASVAMAELQRAYRKEAYDLQSQILENRIVNAQAIARIQDLVFQSAPLPLVLRLVALLCLVRCGIKENVLQNLLNGDILKTYGFNYLLNFEKLYTRGLIFSSRGSSFLLSSTPFASFGLGGFGGGGSSNTTTNNDDSRQVSHTGANPVIKTNGAGGSGSITSTVSSVANLNVTSSNSGTELALETTLSQHYSWYTLNKAYKTCPSDIPNSPEAKPYAGLVPLTARITQMAMGIIPVAKTPLEPEFQTEVHVSRDKDAAREAKLRRTLVRNSPEDKKPVVLVMVVGGVTYSEAEAIKAAIEPKVQREYKVVIASTCVITGDDIVL